MRTKHLFYALALAAGFAACTQDEFVTNETGEALAGRKLLGDVTLTEAAETRWAFEGLDITAKAGDAMSLLLVDKMNSGLNAQHDYAIDNYTLDDQIWSNFMFKRDARGWSGDARLVEGNYLFVAPAQTTLERGLINITMPAEQTVKKGSNGELDPESILKAFAESGAPIAIGHRFLSLAEPEDRNVPGMQAIFAYPEITITNPARELETGATTTVTKVVIKYANGKKFAFRGTLDNKKAANLLTSEVFGKRGTDKKNQVLVGNWAGNMNPFFGSTKYIDDKAGASTYGQPGVKADGSVESLPTNATFEVTTLDQNGKKDACSTYLYRKGLKETTAKTSSLIKEVTNDGGYIVINLEGGKRLAPGESFTFKAIMPANAYTSTDLELHVVLANNEVWKKTASSSKKITMYPGKRYPVEDYTNGLVLKSDAGKFFTVGTDERYYDSYGQMTNVTSTSDALDVFEAKTTEDLKNIIENNTAAHKITIEVTGNNVVYNQEINNIAASTDCQEVEFQGLIKIEGATGSNYMTIYENFNFDKAIITKGNVSMQGMTYTKGFVELTVNEEANLRLYGGYVGQLTNYGNSFLSWYATSTINYGRVWIMNSTGYYGDTAIDNRYWNCTDYEKLSDAIIYEPEVVVVAGRDQNGKYTVSKDIDYPITVQGDSRYPGVLDLEADINAGAYVEWAAGDYYYNPVDKRYEKWNDTSYLVNACGRRGSIDNSGKITSTTGKTLTLLRGFKNVVNNEGAEISCDLVLEGHTATPVITEAYMEGAVLTNNGKITSNNLENDGTIVMGANSELAATNVTTPNWGEYDNTAKGLISSTLPSNSTVYAKVDNVDISTTAKVADWRDNTLKPLNTNYGITEIRIYGEVDFGTSTWNGALSTVTLSFREGSSLKAGVNSNTIAQPITINAKDVKLKGLGATKTAVKFGAASKGFYIGPWAGSNPAQYQTQLGNIKVDGWDRSESSVSSLQ